jgi:hypothetical protein
MDEGEIEVLSLQPISIADVTPALARESGFQGVVDLLKVAKHGPGENVYLVRFRYIGPGVRPGRRRRRATGSPPAGSNPRRIRR